MNDLTSFHVPRSGWKIDAMAPTLTAQPITRIQLRYMFYAIEDKFNSAIHGCWNKQSISAIEGYFLIDYRIFNINRDECCVVEWLFLTTLNNVVREQRARGEITARTIMMCIFHVDGTCAQRFSTESADMRVWANKHYMKYAAQSTNLLTAL